MRGARLQKVGLSHGQGRSQQLRLCRHHRLAQAPLQPAGEQQRRPLSLHQHARDARARLEAGAASRGQHSARYDRHAARQPKLRRGQGLEAAAPTLSSRQRRGHSSCTSLLTAALSSAAQRKRCAPAEPSSRQQHPGSTRTHSGSSEKLS